MGAHFMDYIIADPIVIPPALKHFYSEKIAYLPQSFQANDDQRPYPATPFPRSRFGLASDTFVFCCMNNTYKITPTIFGVWMDILGQVKNSVLWLYVDSDEAKSNLILECIKKGIEPNRLIFTSRLPYVDHLTRFQCADLFLDTYPFNGGTTISDALWSGLPVITCAGEAFASRMGASLLTAVGLSELIALTLEEYVVIAINLAKNPTKLTSYRHLITKERLKSPLFKTSLFTRSLEAAYEKMHLHAVQGLPASDLTISNLE
jgi:predicted O-linked N-acetylglucosamine transferase (SPINDLY family)